MTNITKTELRKAVGRGKFTVADLAEARGVKPRTAGITARDLLGDGVIEKVGTEKVLTEDGEPSRGRPRNVFRVAKGK